MKKVFLIIFLTGLFLLPFIAFSAGLIPCGGAGEDPCKFCHIFVMLGKMLNFLLFTIVPVTAVLMLTVGGAMMIFAGGRPAMVGKGRTIITAVVIGLVIIYCAWLLVNTFFAIIGFANFGGAGWNPAEWFKIDCPIP